MDKSEPPLMLKHWIKFFVAHVVREVPTAPVAPLVKLAAELYQRLGMFDPAEVAEAEWEYLPLEPELASSAS